MQRLASRVSTEAHSCPTHPRLVADWRAITCFQNIFGSSQANYAYMIESDLFCVCNNSKLYPQEQIYTCVFFFFQQSMMTAWECYPSPNPFIDLLRHCFWRLFRHPLFLLTFVFYDHLLERLFPRFRPVIEQGRVRLCLVTRLIEMTHVFRLLLTTKKMCFVFLQPCVHRCVRDGLCSSRLIFSSRQSSTEKHSFRGSSVLEWAHTHTQFVWDDSDCGQL